MKNIYRLLPIFLLFFWACESSVQGEGNADLSQDFKVEPFKDVSAKGSFKLILVPNDSSYVSVQTHRNLIENMDIYVQNNTLHIGEKKTIDKFESYVVYLYFNENIDEITIENKVLLESSSRLTFDKLDIEAKEESNIHQFDLIVKELDLSVADKAEVTLTGQATTLDLESKGYAKVNLTDYLVKVMEVDLAGETDVEAKIDKELSGRVLENATLHYTGNPVKDVEVKDNGEILND